MKTTHTLDWDHIAPEGETIQVRLYLNIAGGETELVDVQLLDANGTPSAMPTPLRLDVIESFCDNRDLGFDFAGEAQEVK